jgi:Pin2-interacting protein X1
MEIKLEDTLNRAWKDDKTGFGYRMLQKMGWKEEKGLGKNETGMAAAIKIKKREDGLGLGVEKDHAGNNGWGSTVSSFRDVLELLNTTYGTTSKKKSKKHKKTPSIQVRIK